MSAGSGGPTRANGQPAVATYAKGHDDAEHKPFGISVLQVEAGRIVEIVAFHDLRLFPAFALPTEFGPAS